MTKMKNTGIGLSYFVVGGGEGKSVTK